MFPLYFPPATRSLLRPVLHYYRRLLRSSVAAANGVLAVSSTMLEWALPYADRPRSALDRVFYLGFDSPPAIAPTAHAFDDRHPLNCVFMSTCGQSYDGSLVVAAAAILEASGERRIRFQIVGDGEMRPKWMSEASGLSTVQFTGWLKNEALESCLAQGHVGLVLMRGGITRFWLGNKFFEYLAHSLAIVNNVPGDAEMLVRTHELGLNVIPSTPEALAAALRELVDHPERLERNRSNAVRAARDEFERSRVYDRYIDHLDKILQRPRSIS
jgi:hypothetical protein